MKRRYTRSQRQQLKKFRTLGVLIFAAVMAIGAFIGLLFFVRPKKSTVEKRMLAKFPSFTITSFLDGSYFEDVSLWYSDTYPMRDKLVSADQALRSCTEYSSERRWLEEMPRAMRYLRWTRVR